MRSQSQILLGILACAAAFSWAARPASAFLGFADTSFVTVIANPAEAANWGAELSRLNDQLTAAKATLSVAGDLRSYAGDPRAAVASLVDLGNITGAVHGLSSAAQTDADLARAWQSLAVSQQLSSAEALLKASGPGSTMEVFSQPQARNAALYAQYASDTAASQQIRSQISQEQSTRASIASELADAWSLFRTATTESGKQAILTEISQLQSQDQVMDTRRRAMLDDLELADRQNQTASKVRSKAADEKMLAESALLNADVGGRARSAEAQRLATLQKAPVEPSAHDYSGMKLWTTADAGGAPD
jgi:hypothetical protein